MKNLYFSNFNYFKHFYYVHSLNKFIIMKNFTLVAKENNI